MTWEAIDGQVRAAPSAQAAQATAAIFALTEGEDGPQLRVDHLYAGSGQLTIAVLGKGSFDVPTWRFLLAAADGSEGVSVK